MCGFAGIIAWDERRRVDRAVLDLMSTRIAHRGPDGAGLLVSHASAVTPLRPQAGLVHRRLAILDLDPRADQPFTDGRKRWIVFNGEIYNFRALREELSRAQPDYVWRTTGDTEVLLLAYDVWGDKCVEKLNGMFAFAVWDEAKGQLFLARDRMGQKPLYVAFLAADAEVSRGETHKPGEGNAPLAAVAFASELKALFAAPWVDRSIRNDALVEYLLWGYVPSPLTMYEGVWQIKPGETMTVRHEGGRERSYFDPNRLPEPGDAHAAGDDDATTVRRTRELVAAAVQRQLVSDVPVGCFLSGGIDSSIVAAAMRAGGQSPLTFCIGFDDARYDESRYAARVAKHLGTTHHEFMVHPAAAADLPKVAAACGQPFGDSSALPTYYLAMQTRPHVKVALSGDGGDELFGGYDRYRAMALGRRLRAAVTPLPWMVLAPLANVLLPGSHPKSRMARAKRFLASLPLPPAARYSQYLQLFQFDELPRLLRPDVRDYFWLEWDRTRTHYEAMATSRGAVEAALAVDRSFYLPDDLLTKVDRCSMRFNLEVRSPFMDHELVQFAAGLRERQLFAGKRGKRLLREAFAADLPAEVLDRPKMGFAVPVGEWFRGDLRDMLRGSLMGQESFASQYFEPDAIGRLVEEHERQYRDHTQRLYALLMLELWWREMKG